MSGGLEQRFPNRRFGLLRISSDPRLLLLLLAFCEKNIVRYFVLVVSMLPVLGWISNAIVPALYILLLFVYLETYGFHVSIKEISVILFIVISIAFTCIIYPENSRYIFNSNNFWNTIFPCLRYYIIGLIIIPDTKTLDSLGKVSCLAIIVESLFVVLYMIPKGLTAFDDMNRAYQILPNVLLALNYAFKNKSVMTWICSGIGLFYCLSMGTRGPIIILLSYLFVKMIQSSSFNKNSKVIVGISIVGIGFYFLNTNVYLSSLVFLRNLIMKMGLSSRVVDMAIKGTTTTYLSGRDTLYEIVLQKISERPILGYGVYGEWPWIQWNAHNMALELMVHYGVILGSLLLLWLIVLTIKAYVKTPNKISRDFLLIWSCFVFVRGIFGGSYLQFGVFVLIGFSLRELRRIKNHFYDKTNIDYMNVSR